VPAPQATQPGEGGYVVGNFGIAAQISEFEGLATHIKVNPPRLGEWLQDFANGKFRIEHENGASARQVQLHLIEVSRLYPEYRATFAAEGRLTAEVDIFAPLSLTSSIDFLPVLIARITLKADSPWKGRVGCTLTPKTLPSARAETLKSGMLAGLMDGSAFLGLAGVPFQNTTLEETANDLTVATSIRILPGAEQTLTFVLGSFDTNGYYAKEYSTAAQLLTAVAAQVTRLETQLGEFTASLPVTGDTAIDSYLRWYTSSGILLTKGVRTGEVLTMGYRELNQRDSFWSSGIHLVFWPDLERKMLMETIQGQLPSGRIPVCLLPLIDRGDELDSAEYFILRVARYYKWHRDGEFLAQAWPAVKRAIAYLVSRDFENVGVPMQTSYWADWKDVPGVEGRKYAPHFVLLWVAALKAASGLAVPAHDSQATAEYMTLERRAEEFINGPVDEGGLWNGRNYVDRWQDGRRPDYVLQDQTVGAYFDVIPPGRLKAIYRQLEASETEFGVRETFPYIKAFDPKFGEGDYHNGGVWPWLNFMDAAGRYAHGYASDAERIIGKVGRADLEAEGDYQPGERMNGDTGQNLGIPIQAWNADLFSTIYFGAFGIERVSDSEIDIRVRTPGTRDFSTRLILPGGAGTLSNRSGKLSWQKDPSRTELRPRIAVRVFDERKQMPEAALGYRRPRTSAHPRQRTDSRTREPLALSAVWSGTRYRISAAAETGGLSRSP